VVERSSGGEAPGPAGRTSLVPGFTSRIVRAHHPQVHGRSGRGRGQTPAWPEDARPHRVLRF